MIISYKKFRKLQERLLMRQLNINIINLYLSEKFYKKTISVGPNI